MPSITHSQREIRVGDYSRVMQPGEDAGAEGVSHQQRRQQQRRDSPRKGTGGDLSELCEQITDCFEYKEKKLDIT